MANITITKTYKITYSVQYFHNAEGGMDTGHFGNDVNTLEEAITLWELAYIHHPRNDWVIVTDVEQNVHSKKN